MISKIKLLSLCLVFIAGEAVAQIPKKPDPKFEIYLLMGQSNMAGRGPLTPEFLAMSDPNVLVWNSESKWAVAKHPLHYDKPKAAGVGPGLAFGMAMAAANPEVKIGLVPCAVGGTSINVWKPGAFDKATNTHPYDDALVRINEAKKYGVVKGIIWLQGESDSAPKNLPGYLDKLTTLFKSIRCVVGNKKLPIVVGQLGRYNESYGPFNQQLEQAPTLIKHLAIATSENLVDKGDNTHFDGASATIYGGRFATKMLALQDKTKK